MDHTSARERLAPVDSDRSLMHIAAKYGKVRRFITIKSRRRPLRSLSGDPLIQSDWRIESRESDGCTGESKKKYLGPESGQHSNCPESTPPTRIVAVAAPLVRTSCSVQAYDSQRDDPSDGH